MHAHVTSASQSYRLREQMERSDIRHGDTARADIPRVRVGAGAAAEGHVFFCEVGPIDVRRHIVAGDDAPLPETVEMEGFDFPGPGEYDVIDALVTSNGDIRIVADQWTEVRARPRFPALTVL